MSQPRGTGPVSLAGVNATRILLAVATVIGVGALAACGEGLPMVEVEVGQEFACQSGRRLAIPLIRTCPDARCDDASIGLAVSGVSGSARFYVHPAPLSGESDIPLSSIATPFDTTSTDLQSYLDIGFEQVFYGSVEDELIVEITQPATTIRFDLHIVVVSNDYIDHHVETHPVTIEVLGDCGPGDLPFDPGLPLLFARHDGADLEIHVATMDEPLTENDADDSDPSWSPDRSQIAFLSGEGAPANDLWVMNADGTGRRQLPTGVIPDLGTVRDPAWSPADSRIAFVLDMPGGDGIRTIDSQTGEVVTYTSDPRDRHPTWSPDGTRMVFERGGDLYIINDLDGTSSTVEPLLVGAAVDRAPAWSALDRIAFTRDGEDIYSIAPDGTDARPILTTSGPLEGPPAWYPDGTRIAYRSNNEIWVLDLAEDTPTRLGTGGPAQDPDWGRPLALAPR